MDLSGCNQYGCQKLNRMIELLSFLPESIIWPTSKNGFLPFRLMAAAIK